MFAVPYLGVRGVEQARDDVIHRCWHWMVVVSCIDGNVKSSRTVLLVLTCNLPAGLHLLFTGLVVNYMSESGTKGSILHVVIV